MLRRLIQSRERKLSQIDSDRKMVRPFEWGLEFLSDVVQMAQIGESDEARKALFDYNRRAIAESERFFEHPRGTDFSFDGYWLSFPSPLETPYEKNNTTYARYFPVTAGSAKGSRGRAVIVLPQWNAKMDSHIALCRWLNRVRIAALRLSLPYHDRRMLDGFDRADYLVSANVGRTLQATRQAVLETRVAVDWLASRGYDRIGILGTSIGSCIGFLAFLHDERLRAGVFNHVSSYFGDVVWDGITTAHVRRGLEAALTREDVHRAWLAISPNSYIDRLGGDRRRGLFISARYDLSFTPELSELLFDECDRHGSVIDRRRLPCGHYTIGEAPFKYLDGYLMINYLRKHL